MMYQNPNNNAVTELAAENYKAHTARNRMAILAVALTTILIAVIFTVGFSLINTVYLSTDASPGPGADGSFAGTYENAAEAGKLPQVEWAALVQRCSTTFLHNKELAEVEVRLLAPDDVHYEKNMVKLKKGKYPEKTNEILLSDTISEKLELSEEIGITYSITVVIESKGGSTEKVIPMTVCGYYKNPLANISNIYEEIYTDESFIAVYNPQLPKGYDEIYVKLNNLDFWRIGNDKEEKLEEVNDASGGNGIRYKMSNTTYRMLIPAFALVLIIMVCGYFFIYNVFYISIVNDIRFFGELKTIGATSRQLRNLLLRQMNRIAVIGIVIGCILGYVIGCVASDLIIPLFADGISDYYVTSHNVWIFLLTALFSWLTVFISTMKPFKLACGISPIEAARYRGKKKKGVFSIISFMLGGILFLTVYTVTIGYQVEHMISRYNQTDIRVKHKGAIWDMNEPYSPLAEELLDKIEKLPFVEKTEVFYQARTKPDFYTIGNGAVTFYKSSVAEIKKEGKAAEDAEAFNRMDPERQGTLWKVNERGNIETAVMGIPAESLEAEKQYIEVLEGELDSEKFASGQYMLYQRPRQADAGKENESFPIHAGDELSVSFYNQPADRYVEKKITVMAVVEKDDMYGTGNISYNNIVLSDGTFKSIYSNYGEMISAIQITARQGDWKAQNEEIEQLIGNSGNFQLMVDSKYKDYVSFSERKEIIKIFGFFLAALVGLIGISNLVNTIVTDVISRKIEFATMQAVGLTKKQMQTSICRECMRYVLISSGLAICMGMPLTAALAQDSTFTGFSLSAFIQALVLLLVFSTALCGMMSLILTRTLNKKSIVERLREIN